MVKLLQDTKTKKRRTAAAIQYDPDNDAAPILAAFGEGHMADKIIETAEEVGVPVLPDPDLAAMLAKMSVGDEIPPALYEVVAKVLIFVGEMDQSYNKKIKQAAKSAKHQDK